MTLGQKIKEGRRQKGLTQSDVADSLGVSIQAVSQWENDKTVPTAPKLLDLAQLLDISLDSQLTIREVAFHHPTAYDPSAGVQAPLVTWGNPSFWNEPDPSNSPDGNVDTRQYLQVTWKPVGEVYALRIRQHTAMEPEFMPGDIVIIDTGRAPERGDYVIAKIDHHANVILAKYEPQISGFRPTAAFNLIVFDSKSAILVNDETPGYVVGTVREHRRFFRQS